MSRQTQPPVTSGEPTGSSYSLAFDVYVVTQRLKVLLTQGMTGAPLTPDQYAVYSVVDQEGPATQTRMAEVLGMPVTTLADFVRLMDRRGHLRRVADPSDRRASLLSLTAEGRAAHGASAVAFDAVHRRLEEQLTLPLEEVGAALRELGAAISAASDATAQVRPSPSSAGASARGA